MAANRPLSKAQSTARCDASGNLCNAGEGLIWLAERLIFRPSEHRCDLLSFVKTGQGILVRIVDSVAPESDCVGSPTRLRPSMKMNSVFGACIWQRDKMCVLQRKFL